MCVYVVVYIYQAPNFALVLVCRFICLFFKFIYLFSMTLPQTEDPKCKNNRRTLDETNFALCS